MVLSPYYASCVGLIELFFANFSLTLDQFHFNNQQRREKMSLTEEIKAVISKQAGNIDPLGSVIKFVLDDQPILIDGTGDSNVVSDEDKEADCTITTSAETIAKMKSGDLNPMMAVMSGKVKIKGDMGLAMKLQSLLG